MAPSPPKKSRHGVSEGPCHHCFWPPPTLLSSRCPPPSLSRGLQGRGQPQSSIHKTTAFNGNPEGRRQRREQGWGPSPISGTLRPSLDGDLRPSSRFTSSVAGRRDVSDPLSYTCREKGLWGAQEAVGGMSLTQTQGTQQEVKQQQEWPNLSQNDV